MQHLETDTAPETCWQQMTKQKVKLVYETINQQRRTIFSTPPSGAPCPAPLLSSSWIFRNVMSHKVNQAGKIYKRLVPATSWTIEIQHLFTKDETYLVLAIFGNAVFLFWIRYKNKWRFIRRVLNWRFILNLSSHCRSCPGAGVGTGGCPGEHLCEPNSSNSSSRKLLSSKKPLWPRRPLFVLPILCSIVLMWRMHWQWHLVHLNVNPME